MSAFVCWCIDVSNGVIMVFSKIKVVFYASCLAFSSMVAAQDQIAVGVSMPEFSNMRWVNDGLSIMRELNKLNLTSDL